LSSAIICRENAALPSSGRTCAARKGNIITAGRKSPLSLYRPDIATMENGESVCN